LLAAALLDLGGNAVQEDDRGWITHLPATWDPGEPEALATELAAETGLDDLDLLLDWQDHADWSELWKAGLEPRRVTPRLVITPSWKIPDLQPGDLCITLDPGMAFGNAEHGTTRGCLRLMDPVVCEGDRVLDVGAGSAVLSIAAAMMGATRVEAIEADDQAVPTARENVADNGVADRVTVELLRADAEALAARGREAAEAGHPYDLVIANIEGFLLAPLLPGLAAATRPGGYLLLSGILVEEWEEYRPRVEAQGVRTEAVDEDGIWVSARFVR